MLAPTREHVSDHIKRLLADASQDVPRRDDHRAGRTVDGRSPRAGVRRS
ncbi:MAG: hypothetical protein ACLQNG_09365 [Acidimicrobiales bacterium]|jgi:hypothetical protein